MSVESVLFSPDIAVSLGGGRVRELERHPPREELGWRGVGWRSSALKEWKEITQKLLR